jgi:AGZA family xanthine/uracil permease-like MFS transporter
MEKFFHLKERGTTVQKELVAGITTFLTMAYILAAIPGTLGSIGGGINTGAVFTATALTAGLATLVIGFAANLPVALAPNIGLSAFITFTVVYDMGYSWQAAMTAVFIMSILYLVLSLTGLRKLIMDGIPLNLKKAITVGIGLKIAQFGFEQAGVTAGDSASLALGTITSPSALIMIIGLLITIALYSKHVPGAILLGIIATTIVGAITTSIVGIPFWGAPLGNNFSPFSLPAAPVFLQFDFSAVFTWKFFVVVFVLLFIDIFDTVGALVGVSAQAGLIQETGEGDIPQTRKVFLSAAVGGIIGTLLGTAPVTAYAESGAGVGTGGRTGLTSLFTGVLFLLALFISPLFLIIPNLATAPALVLVGFLLMWKVTEIEFTYPTEAIPAFLTIIMMPFTYNITEGIVYGLLSFVLIKTLTGKGKYVPAATWILSVIFILRFFIH